MSISEEFDKQLSAHIADTFDHYEGRSADAGWALLRQKYPEKDKRRPVAWWWYSAAAGLLLLSAAAFWLYKGDASKNTQAPKEMVKIKPLVTDTVHRKASPGMPLTAPANAQHSGVQASGPVGVPVFAHVDKKGHAANAGNDTKNAYAKAPDSADDNGMSEPQAKTMRVTEIPLADTAQKADVLASVQPAATQKADSAVQSKKVNTLLADKAKPVQTKGKAVVWSVFASAYNNFASKSVAGNHTGGGFGTDIRLNRMFALSTGLGIFQNSIGYNPNAGLMFDAALQVPSTYYSVNNYRANLLALELPLRLNYILSKQGNYVSAGISSAVYITETYHQTNNYFNTTPISGLNTTAQVQSQDVVTEMHFQTFAFAKSFDIAAGFGYPLGKNRMVLEPFVKLPLNTLNRVELNYGAIGANLKFSFGTGK
jgi:hypothetical protein